MCLKTGERISVAIKTCKDCSADVKEKFLSEAGEYVIISYQKTHCTSQSQIRLTRVAPLIWNISGFHHSGGCCCRLPVARCGFVKMFRLQVAVASERDERIFDFSYGLLTDKASVCKDNK